LAKILIADDDPAAQTTVRLLLARAGHQVVAAGDGRRALDQLQSGDFDLLFLDLFMAGMDGFETVRLVRQQHPSVQIIVISGHSIPSGSNPSPDFLTMATKLGAVRSLQKPFRPDALLQTVAACLEDAKRSSSARTAGNIASGS
jgi:CheY-like chemotaxis protein